MLMHPKGLTGLSTALFHEMNQRKFKFDQAMNRICDIQEIMYLVIQIYQICYITCMPIALRLVFSQVVGLLASTLKYVAHPAHPAPAGTLCTW